MRSKALVRERLSVKFYYTIYGLPDGSPFLENTKDDTPLASPKYFKHWEVISEEVFDFYL